MTNTEKYQAQLKKMHEVLGNCCAKCGSTTRLEIDHIDPSEKVYTLSGIWSYSWNKIRAELAKCQLLCKPCHDEKSYGLAASRMHGTYSSYKHRKCRCELCTIAAKQYRATYARPCRSKNHRKCKCKTLPCSVTGNTPDFGSGDFRFKS